MTPLEIEVALKELEERVDRLRALYEQYFMGYEKLEPMVPRKEVERRFAILRKEQIRNTAQRFRYNVVQQKYNTYAMYWQRITRQIDEGTYKRHVQRAKQRFGDVTAAALSGSAERPAERERAAGVDLDHALPAAPPASAQGPEPAAARKATGAYTPMALPAGAAGGGSAPKPRLVRRLGDPLPGGPDAASPARVASSPELPPLGRPVAPPPAPAAARAPAPPPPVPNPSAARPQSSPDLPPLRSPQVVRPGPPPVPPPRPLAPPPAPPLPSVPLPSVGRPPAHTPGPRPMIRPRAPSMRDGDVPPSAPPKPPRDPSREG